MLKLIQNKHPEIDTIHYFSDGPCTQYNQKANVFLLTQSLSQRGMTFGTWNFFESGHRKGVPDGWVPPLGECLTALFTKEVTAKMSLICIQTWKVPNVQQRSTLPCTSRGHWNFNSNYDIVAEDISSLETLTGRNYQLDTKIMAEVESAL